MVELGYKNEAIQLSAPVADPTARFELVGWTLTRAGYVSDALQLALEIQVPEVRSRSITGIFQTFLDTAEANRVILLARRIADPEKRSIVLHEISAALHKFGTIALNIAGQLENKPRLEPKRKAAGKPGRKSKPKDAR
jgi:hypothetical protein